MWSFLCNGPANSPPRNFVISSIYNIAYIIMHSYSNNASYRCNASKVYIHAQGRIQYFVLGVEVLDQGLLPETFVNEDA